MGKNTSISIGPHFDAFIRQQVEKGRYTSSSEVVRAGLRLLEQEEEKLESLRYTLSEGEQSGFVEKPSRHSFDRSEQEAAFKKFVGSWQGEETADELEEIIYSARNDTPRDIEL